MSWWSKKYPGIKWTKRTFNSISNESTDEKTFLFRSHFEEKFPLPRFNWISGNRKWFNNRVRVAYSSEFNLCVCNMKMLNVVRGWISIIHANVNTKLELVFIERFADNVHVSITYVYNGGNFEGFRSKMLEMVWYRFCLACQLLEICYIIK